MVTISIFIHKKKYISCIFLSPKIKTIQILLLLLLQIQVFMNKQILFLYFIISLYIFFHLNVYFEFCLHKLIAAIQFYIFTLS